MLNTILQNTSTGSEQQIVSWTRMLSYIAKNANMYTKSLKMGPPLTPPWAQKIYKILSAINIDALMQLTPTQRYSSVLMETNTKLNWLLAPNYSVPSLTNQFVSSVNNDQVQEYLIPCQKEYPLMQLPLGKSLQYWEDIHPINIIYNDSTELCSYILKMQYSYKKSSPSLIIATVDIPSLVLKYCAYIDDMKKNGKEYTIYTYIRDQLVDNFYMDCVRCWTFTVMNSYFDHNEIESTSPLIADNASVKEGRTNLDDFYRSIRGKHFTVEDFLYTKWVPTLKGPISFIKYMKWFNENIVFPDFIQAQYLKVFTQFPIVNLIVRLYDLGDRSRNQPTRRIIYHKLLQLDRSRILQICTNRKLRSQVNREIRELVDLCKPDEYSL